MSRIVCFLTQGLSATDKKLKPKFFPLVSAGDVGLPGPAGNDRYIQSLMIHTLVLQYLMIESNLLKSV
jgi:hypothetical protein